MHYLDWREKMSEQKDLNNWERSVNMVEDKYGDEYEMSYAAAGHFGTSQTNVLLIGLITQIKEMNRLMYNHWEARQ